MSSDLINKLPNLSKNECITLLKGIIRRVAKTEKIKPYTGRPSPSFCGNGRTPRGRVRGNGAECIRKGVGVGKAQGVIAGVNKEREYLYRKIERVLKD